MEEKYDVVIIGAGIGGLVCGCYLAKAGFKVLIVEQHNKPGGYCTSFERKGFKFDVGPHCLGSFREGGVFLPILKDLGLLNRIEFITNDPTDVIIMPDKKILIRKDKNDTKKELIAHFPREKDNIESFFNFILSPNPIDIFVKIKKITFKELLDNFFSDYKLKTILSLPGTYLELPPSKASALVCVILYREFILDGGYYPKGGMQVFPDSLAHRLKEYGGELLLSQRVNKIITKNKKISGIKLEGGEFIAAKVVVSNADSTLTFSKLLDCDSEENKITNQLETSLSAFGIYLGLNKELNITPKHYYTSYLSTYDVEKAYEEHADLYKKDDFSFIFYTFSSLIDPTVAPKNKGIMRVMIGAKYEDKYIWDKYAENIANKLLEKTEHLFPGVKDSIEVKEIATPYTFHKFTSNKNGALFGWAAIPSQIDRNVFPYNTSIENLYLSGHWTTNGIGQSGVGIVALCAKGTAKKVIATFKTRAVTK